VRKPPVRWPVPRVRVLSARKISRESPRRRILVVMKPARAANRRFLPDSPFNSRHVDPPVEQFDVQDQVSHDKYGLGRVILIEDDSALVVDFGSRQVRIMWPFAKLTKL
jgi:hypothetical protein